MLRLMLYSLGGTFKAVRKLFHRAKTTFTTACPDSGSKKVWRNNSL